jgi:tetratricopeptide (TPR) repeat protein
LYFRIGLRERAASEYASIALTYLEQDNPKKAKEFFDKAFEYDPGNVSALVGLSRLSLMENNHDEAFKSLDIALSQDPNNKEILLAYAKLAIDSDRKADAKRALALLTDIDPSSMDTKKLVGTLHLKEGLNENAWQELQPVIDNALDRKKWSEAHELLHHFKELFPIPTKQRILRISKAQGDEAAILNVLKELAALHENEGSNEDALKLYKEALELSPDDNACNDKVKKIETTLGITPITTETPAGDQPGVEKNTFTPPAHNEVSFPETETTPEENVSSPHGETVTFEENILNPSETDKEEISLQAETAPEEFPGFETNNVMPAGHGKETGHSQEPQIMSDDEFLARKAEADFYVQQGLENEAVKIYEYLASVFPDNEEIANKFSSLSSDAPQMDDIFIDKEEPAPKTTDNMTTDNVKEDEPMLKVNVNDDLQELFAQLDETAEETVDYEAHYIAGLEFKQKGTLDKAVKELKIAAEDPEKKQRNATMLALCYMEQGSYSLAIGAFNTVIEAMSPSDSTYLHVKYELANAHMQNKDYNKALEFFSEVQALEPTFKDISSKVDSLKAQTQQNTQHAKKDRVSYI